MVVAAERRSPRREMGQPEAADSAPSASVSTQETSHVRCLGAGGVHPGGSGFGAGGVHPPGSVPLLFHTEAEAGSPGCHNNCSQLPPSWSLHESGFTNRLFTVISLSQLAPE